MPALMYKILLLCYVIEHVNVILTTILNAPKLALAYQVSVIGWLFAVFVIFYKFSALSYGRTKLSVNDVVALRWKDTWDFILHKEFV